MMIPISSNAGGIQQVLITGYTGLNFTIQGLSVAGFPSDCTDMVLDATGAISTSGRFAIYGNVDCYISNAGFGTTGSGYLSNIGTLEITTTLGNDRLLCSIDMSTWSGTCRIFDPSNSYLGTATLTYKP